MSQLASYSFLPWLRQGLANRITAADNDQAVKQRAAARVELELSGAGVGGGTVAQPIARDVALFGPGDIVGIDARAVVRTEPRNWVTNFEPNYLAHVEFYDEDFPWRYTPAAPDVAKHRLRPWIMLVVLAESEFKDGANVANRPLPFIEVGDLASFPPAEQLWAWAHVHVNGSLSAGNEVVSTNMGAVLPKLDGVLKANPDLAYSRVVCPRKLAPNTAYHAFVVPAFETGRRAGLGLDPAGSPFATFSAWAPYPAGQTRPEGKNYPVYYRWYFRTGAAGDFESLVRLLQPRPVDTRVGTRDLLVLNPGSSLPPIDHPDLKGVLKLGGALKVPRARFKPEELATLDLYENWPARDAKQFRQKLARLINLADDYAAKPAAAANAATGVAGVQADPDPLITPPLYGTWHALTRRLLFKPDGGAVPNADNWVHDLNLDPRHRAAAGFGTRVVQERQEEYMNAAWEQLGQVLEANRRIRLAQLAKAVSGVWFERHLQPLHAADPERALQLAAPALPRAVAGGFTVQHRLLESRVQPTLTSAVFRRAVQPRGRLTRALRGRGAAPTKELLTRVNDERVFTARPKVTPPGAMTLDELSNVVKRGRPQIGAAADLILAGKQTAKSVALFARSANFVLQDFDRDVRPQRGETDSADAQRFKGGLADAFALLEASEAAAVVAPKGKADLAGLTGGALQALNPDLTIPRRTWGCVRLPPRVRDDVGDGFVEAMAYPEFDTPMYKPLIDLSAELFLPNLNLIAADSITLLETNQPFIEAYMVGLNHEFSRELLWREYPTDQRGSYFRQFWDVTDFFSAADPGDPALRERLRDIPPLHKWAPASSLGDHDHRELAGDKEDELVLVIRGELLKRYPTAVIYAHRAKWAPKPGGGIDPTKERSLEPLTPAEEANPPRAKVRTPLYEAKVEPDIYFFGFDLTEKDAKGGTGVGAGQQDPGWFFVIKERPGEPRFGLDLDKPPKRQVWNDLSWPDVLPGAPGGFLQVTAATPALALAAPTAPEDAEKVEQFNEDKDVAWNKDMSSAELAYILYQAPVLVAVHAAEMLRPR